MASACAILFDADGCTVAPKSSAAEVSYPSFRKAECHVRNARKQSCPRRESARTVDPSLRREPETRKSITIATARMG
jgi:hypothetical protein